VKHWANGGETTLDNLVLLCRFHHRLVHEGGWKVGWWGAGQPVFFDPRGGTHFEGRWAGRVNGEGSTSPGELEAGRADEAAGGGEPGGNEETSGGDEAAGADGRAEQARRCDPVTTLTEENLKCGVRPNTRTAGARWKTQADIPDRVYFRALEALGEGLQ
jgi:hypothetical protein